MENLQQRTQCVNKLKNICDRFCDEEVRSVCKSYQPRGETPIRYSLYFLTQYIKHQNS